MNTLRIAATSGKRCQERRRARMLSSISLIEAVGELQISLTRIRDHPTITLTSHQRSCSSLKQLQTKLQILLQALEDADPIRKVWKIRHDYCFPNRCSSANVSSFFFLISDRAGTTFFFCPSCWCTLCRKVVKWQFHKMISCRKPAKLEPAACWKVSLAFMRITFDPGHKLTVFSE